MGLGAAFVMPSTLSILNSVFPPRERPQAIAAWSAVAGVGIVIGPTLGGLLLIALLVGQRLPDQRAARRARADRRAPDRAGNRRAGPAIASTWRGTVLGGRRPVCHRGRHHRGAGPWLDRARDPRRGGRRARRARRFIWWELRTEHPLIDLRVFTSRAFSAAAASVTIIFFALFGSLFVLTQYLQLVHGYSPLSAGVRALPFALAMGADLAAVSPVIAQRLGVRDRDPGRPGADGPRPGRPVHRGRAHQLPAAGRGRRHHGRGHGPGDGARQHRPS